MKEILDRASELITGSIGKELLGELLSIQWDSPVTKAIDPLPVAMGTHPGFKRERNEDRSAFAQLINPDGERLSVAVVCDGVGGSAMGDVAATLATAALITKLCHTKFQNSIRQALIEAVQFADAAVRHSLEGRGVTTLSTIAITETGRVAAINVGDSRIFSWRPGKNLVQVSVDDTLENELRELRVNPKALDERGLRGSLSQAIGEVSRSAAELRLNVFENQDFEGGGFVLASDGAWKGVTDGFTNIVVNAHTANDAVRRALALATWAGGVDNVSIVAAETLEALLPKNSPQPDWSPGKCRLVVWLGDTKLTISELIKAPLKSEIGTTKDSPRKPIGIFKTAVKKDAQRAKKARTNKKEDAPQMSLVEESEKGNKAVKNRRPEVEISIPEEKK